MSRFPTDKRIEEHIAKNPIDFTIETMCRPRQTPFEGRRRMAGFALTLRGHNVTRDNWEYLSGGDLGTCDACRMQTLVPRTPKEDEWGVYGRAIELNCPVARKNNPARGPFDMTPNMWEMFLEKTGLHSPSIKKSEDPK